MMLLNTRIDVKRAVAINSFANDIFPWHLPDLSLTFGEFPDTSLTAVNISTFSRQAITANQDCKHWWLTQFKHVTQRNSSSLPQLMLPLNSFHHHISRSCLDMTPKNVFELCEPPVSAVLIAVIVAVGSDVRHSPWQVRWSGTCCLITPWSIAQHRSTPKTFLFTMHRDT